MKLTQNIVTHTATTSRRPRGDYRTMTPVHERNLVRRVKRGCEVSARELLEAAESWPEVNFEVLCGHTHSGGGAEIRHNLFVRTGSAEYGAPRVHAVIEVGA